MKPFWRRWLPRQDWDEELESHIQMRSEWNQIYLGLTPEQSADFATVDPAVTATIENVPERLYHLNDRPRFIAFVLLIFAAVSVLLGGTGLFGVIAFLVSSRTREIGIRTALGATRRDILLMVQRQTLVCAGMGIAIGLCGSFALAKLVGTLLFQTSAHDPVAISSAALCLFAVSLLAALRPSWKAARIDPAEALRVEGTT